MADVILLTGEEGGNLTDDDEDGDCVFLERDTSVLHKDVTLRLTEFELHLLSTLQLSGIKGQTWP